MNFKTYVQSVVASYVDKQNSNVIFIKHYNTLDITKNEILADVDETSGKVFLYHEYEMHEMHSTFAPFLQWIRQCYDTYYKGKMTVEYFLRQCNVYSMHIEPLAGFIRNGQCTRTEDVLHFEIQYEAYRMQYDYSNWFLGDNTSYDDWLIEKSVKPMDYTGAYATAKLMLLRAFTPGKDFSTPSTLNLYSSIVSP